MPVDEIGEDSCALVFGKESLVVDWSRGDTFLDPRKGLVPGGAETFRLGQEFHVGIRIL